MTEKGFLTIAIGDKFRRLATCLIKSYRLTQSKTPFFVVTDREDKELGALFDGLIVDRSEEGLAGFLHKLNMYQNSPCRETIFIDADCIIVKNIDRYWELFEQSGQSVSVFGTQGDSEEDAGSFFNFPYASERYGLENFPLFNGGVYYFKKSDTAERVFAKAKELVPAYDALGCQRLRGNINEEPLMSLGMGLHGQQATLDTDNTAMFCTPGLTDLDIDVFRQTCRFLKHGTPVFPSTMHWGTDVTEKSYLYKRERFKVDGLFRGLPRGLIRCLLFFPDTLYRCMVLAYRIARRKELQPGNSMPMRFKGY